MSDKEYFQKQIDETEREIREFEGRAKRHRENATNCQQKVDDLKARVEKLKRIRDND
jgi:peptidoglycan hydrolase CwlO-like protein